MGSCWSNHALGGARGTSRIMIAYVDWITVFFCGEKGDPKTIRVDHGSAFVSRDLICGPMPTVCSWTSHAQANPPKIHLSQPFTASLGVNACTHIGS